MTSGLFRTLIIVLPLCLWLFIYCRPTTPSSTDVAIVELDEFETFVAIEDNIFGTPHILRYDPAGSALFVYDAARAKVFEMDEDGRIVNEFGRRGRGPGEFFRIINNLFLTEDHIYVVDHDQALIHKYNRSGEWISSMNHGELLGFINPPGIPFSPSFLRAEDIHNQPFVTLDGKVLLSRIQMDEEVEAIYELRDWEENHVSDIGEVPEGSAFVVDFDELRTAVSNREIPGYYKPHTFAVHDHANPEEYFIVYSTLRIITKYDSRGNKLWEVEIPKTAEVDSITNRFFETMDGLLQENSIINFRKYNRGVSSINGDLYLAAKSTANNLWIHRFTGSGELVGRYKLIEDSVRIEPIFEIDAKCRRIFVVTEEAEIRVYPF